MWEYSFQAVSERTSDQKCELIYQSVFDIPEAEQERHRHSETESAVEEDAREYRARDVERSILDFLRHLVRM